MKKVYMVWQGRAGGTIETFELREDAVQRAKYLAEIERNATYFVLEAIGYALVKDDHWTDL